MPRTYTEIMYHLKADQPMRKVEHQFTQPPLDRLAWLTYHAWHHLTGRAVIRWIDPLAHRLHARSCDNDCGTWTVTATGEDEPGCTWMPPSCAQDCRCFDLKRRGYLKIGERDLGESSWGDGGRR